MMPSKSVGGFIRIATDILHLLLHFCVEGIQVLYILNGLIFLLFMSELIQLNIEF